MKEVKLKRFAGPFQQIPFDKFIQSPVGLVPKDESRDSILIFHLSYPRLKGRVQKSVNANTPRDLCSVKYPDFMEAVQICLKEGKSCNIAHSDFRSAFRHLGILPLDGKTYYFVDKCLPFESAISCLHFQRFSNAVAHLVQYRTGKPLINYLDDYLFIQLLKLLCNGQVDTFLHICELIKFPVALDKTFRATTLLTFLGLLIDTLNQTISLPIEKVFKARQLIAGILSKRKVTVLKLQQICGFLNFIGRCIVPGRAFTRCLYAHTTGTSHLKPHHHVRVTREMRLDLLMWEKFIHSPQVFCRPFADYSSQLDTEQLDFFSDASGKIGLGAVCGEKFMYGEWSKTFLDDCKPSIEYLELHALVSACLA